MTVGHHPAAIPPSPGGLGKICRGWEQISSREGINWTVSGLRCFTRPASAGGEISRVFSCLSRPHKRSVNSPTHCRENHDTQESWSSKSLQLPAAFVRIFSFKQRNWNLSKNLKPQTLRLKKYKSAAASHRAAVSHSAELLVADSANWLKPFTCCSVSSLRHTDTS